MLKGHHLVAVRWAKTWISEAIWKLEESFQAKLGKLTNSLCITAGRLDLRIVILHLASHKVPVLSAGRVQCPFRRQSQLCTLIASSS